MKTFFRLAQFRRTVAGIAVFATMGFGPILASDVPIDLPSAVSKEVTLNSDAGTTATVEPCEGGFRLHSDFSGGGNWTQYWFKIPPFDGPLKTIKLVARGSGVKLKIGVRDGEKHIVSCEVPGLGGIADPPQSYVLDVGKSREGIGTIQYPIIGICVFVKQLGSDTADVEISKLALSTEE